MPAPDVCTLMCKNHRVARFSYTRRTRTARLLEVCDGSRWAPPGACGPDGQVDALNLNGWVSMRYVPHTREGLSRLLREAGCENPADLMFSSLGLNLSDQYWFLPDGMELDWHDINYFENPYVDGRPNGVAADPEYAIFGPMTSTGGQVVKWWERRGTQNYLVKGATVYNHEPFAELPATKPRPPRVQPGSGPRRGEPQGAAHKARCRGDAGNPYALRIARPPFGTGLRSALGQKLPFDNIA